ncbi:uncharacterized protein LOC143626387 [Bidens hawaiensis]|uniref:uncharacterized protein LOC143626387 n=1 Tax=Bidens hawaiensis TaxID=980011 RepID=UPI00404B74D0
MSRSTTTSLKLQNNEYVELNVENSPNSPQRGVKQDLSEITKTITRQFWGVASLIAPPVPSGLSNERSEGMRRDLAEIGGRVRSELSKFASEFLRVDSDDEECDSGDDMAVGVTDEVVAFVNDVVMHPETWMGFPLPEDEGFNLTDAQQEHVLVVEQLAPRLNALRIELCPKYMSESSFWKIYFVLLHPKLTCNDAEILSTPDIIKARALLTHKFKNRSCSEKMSDYNSKSVPLDVSSTETVKHPIKINDIDIIDKSVIQEESHEEDWLKKESLEIVTNKVTIPIENNEDASFSDLDDDDDDDDGNIPIHYNKTTYSSESSTKDSRNCVDVVDIDVA